MVTKLQLYNLALGHLGPVRLGPSGLTENRPDRLELDAVYDGVIDGMLEEACWFFSLRSQQWTPDTDVDARYGLPYTYSLPTDYKRLRMICTDEDQTNEDLTFKREGSFIFSAHPVLYVTYASNDAAYGLNLGAFTQLYTRAVAAELAYQSGLPITKDRGAKNDLFVLKQRMLGAAKRKEAVDERVKFKPLSSWATSRMGPNRSQRRMSTG